MFRAIAFQSSLSTVWTGQGIKSKKRKAEKAAKAKKGSPSKKSSPRESTTAATEPDWENDGWDMDDPGNNEDWDVEAFKEENWQEGFNSGF